MMRSANADMPGDQPRGAAPEARHERMISARFAQALRDNPQSPHDWLAVAAQLSDDYERSFCLRRADEAR